MLQDEKVNLVYGWFKLNLEQTNQCGASILVYSENGCMAEFKVSM